MPAAKRHALRRKQIARSLLSRSFAPIRQIVPPICKQSSQNQPLSRSRRSSWRSMRGSCGSMRSRLGSICRTSNLIRRPWNSVYARQSAMRSRSSSVCGKSISFRRGSARIRSRSSATRTGRGSFFCGFCACFGCFGGIGRRLQRLSCSQGRSKRPPLRLCAQSMSK